MELNLILFNSERQKARFELRMGRRTWDIVLLISRGSFSLSFPKTGESRVFKPYEIAYIPADTEFVREVIEPIDFHQFSFQKKDNDPLWDGAVGGRLNIPEPHAKAIAENADVLVALKSGDEAVAQLIRQIFTEDYIHSQKLLNAKKAPSRELLKAIEYMESHIAEKIDLDALAASSFVSHSGLIWKFKKELGVTPTEYLTDMRVKKAKQLLTEEDLTVAEVAERCGYANAYYFSNVFKRACGVSPGKFRGKSAK